MTLLSPYSIPASVIYGLNLSPTLPYYRVTLIPPYFITSSSPFFYHLLSPLSSPPLFVRTNTLSLSLFLSPTQHFVQTQRREKWPGKNTYNIWDPRMDEATYSHEHSPNFTWERWKMCSNSPGLGASHLPLLFILFLLFFFLFLLVFLLFLVPLK